MLEGRAEVQRVYEGLASPGIVEHVGEKHLGRFRAVRYPEKDHRLRCRPADVGLSLAVEHRAVGPRSGAADVGPAGRRPAAEGLADFLLFLHVPAETGVPVNPFRGVPLTDRDSAVVERLGDRERYPQAAALRTVWARACAAKAWDGPAIMLHGDLHPGSILLADDGSLAGVIDFGDVGAGDPAVDLAAGWLMFDAGACHRFMDAFGPAVERDTWMRARGWALILSTAMLSNSDDNPRMFAVGEFGIRQILEG